MKKIITISSLLITGFMANNSFVHTAPVKTPIQVSEIKNAVTTMTQHINHNDMHMKLRRMGSEIENMIMWEMGFQVDELRTIRAFSRNNKVLLEKIPAIIVSIIVEFTDAVVDALSQEKCLHNNSLFADYQTIKSHIIGQVDTILTTKAFILPKTCNQTEPIQHDQTKVNKLLEACNADAFTPLLMLLVVNSLREKTDLLENNPAALNPALLTPKFQETARKVLVQNLAPQEIESLTSFLTSTAYKKLRDNFGEFLKIITKYIPEKIIKTVTSIKNWATGALASTHLTRPAVDTKPIIGAPAPKLATHATLLENSDSRNATAADLNFSDHTRQKQ